MVTEPLPDPRRLMSFAVFADHLNFTHAARALHLTQPALHMQVRHLEEEAGTALYRRTASGLRLTVAGTALAQAGRDIARRLEQARRDVDGVPVREPVVLCAGEGALLHLLPAGLQAFVAQQQGVLRVVTADRDGAVAALREGRADLAVTSLDTVPADLEHAVLCDVSPVLAVPRGHRFTREPPRTLAALAGEPMVVPPRGSPLRAVLDGLVPGLQPVMETHGWEVMLRGVAWRMGVAVVGGFCVPPTGVVLVPAPGLPPRVYQMVWHPHRRDHPGVMALRHALVQHAPRAARRWGPPRAHQAAPRPKAPPLGKARGRV